MQSFFDQAIRRKKRNPDKMVVVAQATLSHYLENKNHKFSTKEKDSWCSFQRDKVAAVVNILAGAALLRGDKHF